MEPGRQRLSQRRKAAALTQGPHAEGLLAERSGAELFTVSRTGTSRIEATPPPAPRPFPPAIPASSGRSKRFPVAGGLAVVLAASAASALFMPPTNRPVAPGTAETPARTAPVAVIPASDPVNSTANSPDTGGISGALPPPPPGGSGTASSATTTSAATTASKTHNSQSNHPVPVRRTPTAPAVTAPSDTRPTPADAYDALSRATSLSAGDQRWTHHRRRNT